MHRAALTLMALSLLSACADTVDPGVPAFNNMPYPVAPNGSAPEASVANANAANAHAANANLPFFTTDPAYFANPQPAYYNGGPVYLASAPGYASDVVYFVGSRPGVRYAYCPPRGSRGFARAGGFSRHR